MKTLDKRKFNYRHLVGIAILIASLLYSIFAVPWVFTRTIEMFTDLFESLKFYFLTLVWIETIPPKGIGSVSGVNHTIAFPVTWDEFKIKFVDFWQQFFNGDNFLCWSAKFGEVMLIILTALQLVLILGLLIKLLLSKSLEAKNNDYGVDSKPLKAFKKFERLFVPVKRWFISLKDFFRNTRVPYKKLFIAIWLYNLNIYTMIGEALAFLFYLVSSLDFSIFFTQIYKLIFDISLMFKALPWYVWVFLVIRFLRKRRIKKGLKKLNHMQSQNCGFVKSLGVATLVTGPMNFGKTKLLTSMSLNLTTIYKETAKDSLFKIDFKFRNFPFVNFENSLKRAILDHRIYSLATCEKYVRDRRKFFEKFLSEPWRNKSGIGKEYCYGYNYEEYGLTYDNGMYLENLFDCLETYSKAFYVYVLDCSLISSNYAIREDNIVESVGNFPVWDFDFFNRNPSMLEDVSYFSKILDFDTLRKGKKVVPFNELADTLEFGVITITELDKERGNTQDTKELKKMVDEANQKNDLFNYSLKMGRHPSTIDYKPYIKFLLDLQRSMKVDADLREVCSEVLDIIGTQERELALPWFFFEEFLYGLLIPKFKDTYEMYRFYHGNNTLFMYLLRKLCVPLHNHYHNTYNKFGFDITYLNVQNGKLEDVPVEKKYFVLYKKDFANRYSTDSHADFYRQSALQKNKGLIDYPSYGSSRATLDELNLQNSYFIRDLENVTFSDSEENQR